MDSNFYTNRFDECFEKVSSSRIQTEAIRTKVIESVVELSEIKRSYNQKQREWAEIETDVVKLSETNLEKKESLLKALLDSEELSAKKLTLESLIDRLNQQLEELDKETLMYLTGDMVDHICERYSTANQLSLMNKIQDAKCKLINKYNYQNL